MEEKGKRQLLIIKICCVIASFVLWLYIFNVENPMRDRTIVVPVQVTNENVLAQSKLIPVVGDQLNVSLTIRGDASDVYAAKPENFKLESDLSGYVMKKGENNVPVEIKKAPDNIRIVNSNDLWVKITLDDLKQKKVSIKMMVEGKTKEGFFALHPILKTNEVQVSGPASLVDSVSNVGLKYNVNGLTRDLSTTLPLQPQNYSGTIIKGVDINPNSVEITIPVKKVKSVPISVKVQGGAEINSITPVPAAVDIAGEENVISNIASIDTEPVDINKIGNDDTIEVKIIVPKGVTLVNSDGTIKLKVDINKETQKELNLDIQTINLGNDYTVALSSSKATVTITGPENVVNNINPEDVTCSVDLNSLDEGEHTVNVSVNLPQGVSKASQDPLSVIANISKKVLEGKNDDQSK